MSSVFVTFLELWGRVCVNTHSAPIQCCGSLCIISQFMTVCHKYAIEQRAMSVADIT